MTFASDLTNNHGIVQAVKILKDLDSRVKLVASGQKVTKKSFGNKWLKVTTDGLPYRLKALRGLVKSNPCAAINITALVRLVRLSPNTDISTITGPSTAVWPPIWIGEFETFVKNNLKQSEIKAAEWHTSTKAGPNGQAAVVSSGIDAIALAMSPGLKALFEQGCISTGNNRLLIRLNGFLSEVSELDDKKLFPVTKWPDQMTNAKLAFLSDNAGKTRVVYILNYWWQELLLPLHNAMMKWLRHQVQDGTFDQKRAVSVVQQWTKEGKPLWSFDLTAATDRWPKIHQYICVSALGGPIWSKVWLGAMGINPFSKPHKTWVSYSVGQPMGAYASWAALAVTHHMLIRWCARLAKVDWECYVVLGDDVVISDPKVASLYKAILTDLGVTISESKSVLFENQITGSSAEFAKQTLFDGKDLSPTSPALVKEIYDQHQWWKILDVIRDYRLKFGLDIIVEDESIYVPTPINLLILGIPAKYHKKLMVLLADPQGPASQFVTSNREVMKDKPEGLVTYPNPWKGVSELHYLDQRLEIVGEKLYQSTMKIKDLRDSLIGGGSGTKLPGYFVELESHPIWAVIDRLDGALLDAYRHISTGNIHPDTVRVSMDCDFLNKLLTKGVGYTEWKDIKSRKLKVACTISAELHRKVTLPVPAVDVNADYSDW